jgi:hypothetical protein
MTAHHEFNNRIAAQRAILRTVNRLRWAEPLCGLSSKAIDRWVSANRIEAASTLASLVKEASAKLFFLANKSQEQVTDEYTVVRAEIATIHQAIYAQIDALPS